MKIKRNIFLSFPILLALVASPLAARVLRVQITSRSVVLNGKSFGDAGVYERVLGRVYFSVSVSNPHNQRITDLAGAVNRQFGEVPFSANFVAVRPKDPAKGNGSLLLEVPNRGSARILSLVDGGDEDLSKDAGDAWLLRRGFTVVALGWQWDAPGEDALRLEAPVAIDRGKTITGLLRGDLTPSHPMDEIPLGHLILGKIGGTEYPVADVNDPRNTLTVRDSRQAGRTVIPRAKWQFAHTVNGKLEPSERFIHLDGGFEPGKIYEYVYVVKNPVVAGLGFAAIRDFASYAKHHPHGEFPARRVYGEGISQNGASCAISCIKVSTPTKTARWRWTECSRTWRARAGATSTTASPSLPATRSRCLQSSFPRTSSLSPTCLRPIPKPESRADCSTARSRSTWYPKSFSPTHLMNTGAVPRR